MRAFGSVSGTGQVLGGSGPGPPTSDPSLLRNVSPSICLMLVWRFSAHGNWSANESPSGSSTMCVTCFRMLPSESAAEGGGEQSVGIVGTHWMDVGFGLTGVVSQMWAFDSLVLGLWVRGSGVGFLVSAVGSGFRVEWLPPG